MWKNGDKNLAGYCTWEGKHIGGGTVYDSSEYKLLSVAFLEADRHCPYDEKESRDKNRCEKCCNYIKRSNKHYECLVDILYDVVCDFKLKQDERVKELEELDSYLENNKDSFQKE